MLSERLELAMHLLSVRQIPSIVEGGLITALHSALSYFQRNPRGRTEIA
jgi:hypothetical protein